MKKLIYPIMMAAAVIVAVSCEKETSIESEIAENSNSEFVQWTFTAGMPETKTSLGTPSAGKVSVTWDADDVIRLWYLDGSNTPKSVDATTAAGGANATFTANIPAEDTPDHFWAAYPASAGELTYDGEEKFTITCGRADGSFKAANIMAAYSTAAAKSFAFKHAVGIIEISLPSGGVITHGGTDYTIKTIRVKGKETSIPSEGNTDVTNDGTSVTSFGATPFAVGDVKVVQSAAIDLTPEVRASGKAYIPSFPGTLTNGLAIRYYSDAGNIPAILTKDAAIAVNRGHILPIGDLTGHITWDYYVSPDADGSGNGKSPAAAFNLSQVQAKIAACTLMCYSNELNGTTFHFAEGTYTFTDYFTFPKFSDRTTMNWEGTNSVFDGNETSGLLKFTGTNLIFNAKGFSFQKGKADNGAALNIAVGTVSDSNFIADFENCDFSNNESTADGGAILIKTDVRDGQLRFNNCSFNNNVCTGNGAVLYAAGATMAAMFNKCSFTGNTGTANGMLIYINNASGRLGMNNCTVNAGTSKVKNGSSVTNKGYSVIANSTIWSSSGMGNWGLIALGCATSNADVNGSTIVNCLLKNMDETYYALYLHANYNQNIDYCLYTSLKEATTPLSTYTLTNSLQISNSGLGTKANPTVKINGITHRYYTFTQDLGFTAPSLATVREKINGTSKIGPLFLSWLDSIDESLTTDITGYARDSEASFPGSWQQR